MWLSDLKRWAKRGLASLGVNTPPSARPTGLRYGVAVFAVAAATLFSVWLRPFSYATPFLYFYPAVIFAAWIGGFRPGLLATLLAAIAANYFLFPPHGQFSVDPANLLRTALLITVFASICWLTQVAHKQQANTLAQSEERYRSLFENMLDGFAYCKMLFDERGRPVDFVYLNVNRIFADLTGLEKVVGKRATEVFLGIKESNPELFEIYGRVALTGKPEKFEIEFKPLGAWLSVSVYSKEKEYFAVAFEDVTKRKANEQKLMFQAAALESAANSIVIADREGIILWANPAFTKLTGYATKEVLGQTPRLLKSDKHDKQFYENMWNTILSGAVWEGEVVNRRKDGSLYPEQMTITPVRSENGEISHFVAIKVDITERKRAEQEVIEAKKLADTHLAQLRATLENMSEGVCVCDAEGKLLLVNRAFLQIYGFAEQSLPKSLWGLASMLEAYDEQGMFVPSAERPFQSALRGEAVTQRELRVRRSDTGQEMFLSQNATAVRDASGQVSMAVLTVEDITAAKQAQVQLQQAQKMEAIGRLAGGVAHDFNTLLNIILGYSELVLAEFQDGHPLRSQVEQIEHSANAGALLTKQLLAFSRKQAPSLQVIDLSKAVADLEPLLRRLLREDIELVVRCSDEACPVQADPGQIQQLVLNLVANARDAMTKGGKLTIEVRSVELDEAYVEKHAGVSPGRYEMLAVSDSGAGMDAQTAAHIFEPFFTTKSAGKGTGLGLATVYGIAKQSGGDVWVYSEPGVGSIFKVYLPRTSAAVEVPEPVQSPQNLTGTETILLVEDSAGLRELTRALLSRQGYQVVDAADGIEALEVSKKYAGTIHLLITDIMMPRMRGTELVDHIAPERPDIPVVFLSGYTEEAMSHLQNAERIRILEKPYTSDTLLRTVRQVLDDTQSRAPVHPSD